MHAFGIAVLWLASLPVEAQSSEEANLAREGRDLPQDTCYLLELRERLGETESKPASLGWTTSGAWTASGELLLADHTFKSMITVSPGQHIRVLPEALPVADARQLRKRTQLARLRHGHNLGTSILGLTANNVERGERDIAPAARFSRISRDANSRNGQRRAEMQRFMVAMDDRVDHLGQASHELGEPLYMSPRPEGGFLLADLKQDRVYFVNGAGESEVPFLETRGTRKTTEGTSTELIGVYRAASMPDGVLALIETVEEDCDPKTEFAYLGRFRNEYQPFNIEELFADKAESLVDLRRVFYAKDFMFNAVVDDVGYSLIMEKSPWIAKINIETSKVERLKLPENLDLSFLKPNASIDGLRPGDNVIEWMYGHYRAFEDQRMPAGLFSWKGRLLLLIKSRQNPDTGDTEWQLVQLSAADGSQQGSAVVLPTKAAHLALIPGDDFFAVVEKGPIDLMDAFPHKLLYRPVGEAVLFPAAWISDPTISKSDPQACQEITVNG